MLDTESMIRTKRVICLQKFLEDYESPWKMFLGELLKRKTRPREIALTYVTELSQE